VAYVLAGFHQHLGNHQFGRLAARQNTPTVLVR
jgi:hypothetical protein